MDFAHRPDRAALHKLDDTPVVVRRVNLCAHLRDDPGDARGLGDDARLLHIARERLLAIDVLFPQQRRERGEGVRVLERRDEDRIVLGVLQLVIHLPVVAEFFRLRCFHRGGIEVLRVHVAERDDIFREHLGHVGGAASAAADDGDVQQAVRRRAAEDGGETEHARAGGGGGLEEMTAGDAWSGGLGFHGWGWSLVGKFTIDR